MTADVDVSDEDFIEAWRICQGAPARVAEFLKQKERNIYRRRAMLQKKGIYLQTITASPRSKGYGWQTAPRPYRARAEASIKGGQMVVFSDAHYWPGEPSVAHCAMLKLLPRLNVKMVIANGDLFDGASVSRHDVLGWQELPTVTEELDTVRTRLEEIERGAPQAQRFMTVGNHDSRFDRRLAQEVPQFEGLPGLRLEDHIGMAWPMSYSVMINEAIDPVFVVHNVKGGVHAPYNNVKAAGCTTITGHLHSQKAQPYTTLLHDWEGIDAGMLADRDHAAFSYRMDRPADWRCGFVVMTFDEEGRHFPCEFCRVQWLKDRARAIFRGEVIYERVWGTA